MLVMHQKSQCPSAANRITPRAMAATRTRQPEQHDIRRRRPDVVVRRDILRVHASRGPGVLLLRHHGVGTIRVPAQAMTSQETDDDEIHK